MNGHPSNVPQRANEILVARDGHTLDAYRVRPQGQTCRGAVVVLPEIFGVNAQIRRSAEEFAAAGFDALAPAMFDRIEKGIQLEYSQSARGLELLEAIPESAVLSDLQAAIDAVKGSGAVATVGYCWGGALAYLAACRCDGVSAAVCYYGSRIARFCKLMSPRVPVLYHFGALDKSLPPAAIEEIRAADPRGTVHVYLDADHAFANEDRPQFQPDAARMARRRTLEFIGGSG